MSSLQSTDFLNSVQPNEPSLEFILTEFKLITHEPNKSLSRDIILPVYVVLNFMSRLNVDLLSFSDSSGKYMSDWETVYCTGKYNAPPAQDASEGEDENEGVNAPDLIPKEFWAINDDDRTVFSIEYLKGGMLHTSIIDALDMLAKYIKIVQPSSISKTLMTDIKTMAEQLVKAQAAEKQLVKFQEASLKQYINELEWADFEKEFIALLTSSSLDWVLDNNQESSRFDEVVGNLLLKYIEKCDYPAI